MKVLIICGGRTYSNYRLIDAAIHAERENIRAIVSGGARGADQHAKNSARLRKIRFRECNADWETYGRDAGPLRNGKMLEVAAELATAKRDTIEVWAFREDLWKPDPNTGGNGTLDMVSQALLRDIPVWWYSETLLPRKLAWKDRVIALG